IRFDEWGLDTCFASVQKAWGLPAGFTVCAVSERCMERSAAMENKGYYFDFMVMDKFHQKMQTPATPSIAHLHGLAKVLRDIDSETPAGRNQRHMQLAKTARAWALKHGQQLFPEKGYESVTMTTIRNVRDWPVQDIYDVLETRGYRMDRGYGQIRGETFRIAHMGNVMPDDLEEYLSQFDAVLKKLGVLQ
ncbi:MAG: alanine--glyoxylate aminotransferase family protein, partial [Candidatus Marinimicrobia bacterium]|nr:alanine--glyoxylate aminotransferase family protein [Candidatus Neomarinimicrobiota bacterium]